MRAVVIKRYGGPDVLALEDRPAPVPTSEQVLIEVRAFGLNHAEIYFRSGAWGDVAEITGIECVGLVKHDPLGDLKPGQTVVAIVGGMGRSLNGSYAEMVAVPRSNVAAVQTDLPWEVLAAIPESYATAWTTLIGILSIERGQTLLVRGATSALGQAAINIARNQGTRVQATTRQAGRAELLRNLGAQEVFLEGADLSPRVRDIHAGGIDAVLDIVGNATVLDSLMMLKRGGRVCQVGFLGGSEPLSLQPVFQIPSGRHLSVFASALVTGSTEFPLSEIPFQTIIDRVASGTYNAKPARVFKLSEIQEAHRIMETGQAAGKMVVVVAGD
jgi:NADPH:quinone reductase-like Zn-dependent oxidoreductase